MSFLGIRGFGSILRGGIPARAEVLLLAPEGADRTLLGAHFLLEGLERGERALAVLSGESPDDFLARLGRMGVDVSAALAMGSLAIVDWHTCWTRAVSGVEEDRKILRASRDFPDLTAAIERALDRIGTAVERRALIDVLPRALSALDAAVAQDGLRAVRAAIGKAGATAVFLADPTRPEAQTNALLPSFHAVLEARSGGQDRIEIAVLEVGGAKLTPKHRRIRLREDGASIEAAPVGRTFSCPICDARVPFDADRCPSCGTPRAEMATKRPPAGLMDYVESLGRPAQEKGRVVTPPPPRGAGITNGVRGTPGRVTGVGPGRVNGVAPGRVNGVAAGRVNGIAPGRVNGVAPAGRTNGLVNGIRSARGGITNGLTNGSGFTNGLGGRRARGEFRRSRWKILILPLFAAVLLITPLMLTETPPRPTFAVDGAFDEWVGISGYRQDPVAGVNPSVALTGYKVNLSDGEFHLFASVAGTWFADANEVLALYAFLDTDGNAATGYRLDGFGAELRASVEGVGGAITLTGLRAFSGTDPDNWTAWAPAGSAIQAAFTGGNLELAFPWDSVAWGKDPRILLLAEDGHGSRSYSAAFGLQLGAVRAAVRPVASLLTQNPADLLAVDLEAVGGSVNVTAITVSVDHGATILLPALPIRLQDREHRRVLVRVDFSSVAPGSLLTATVTGLTADRPSLLLGGPVRAYASAAPTAKLVDGWFGDWGPELQTDSDPGPVPADLNLDRYAANRTGGTLFLYGDVKGSIFAGSPVPVHRQKPRAGNGSQTPPVVPARVAGEDVFRVYVDLDVNQSAGIPVLGLRGADLLLEVRGIHGRIKDRTAYSWQGEWRALPTPPEAANNASAFEASFPVPIGGAIEVAFEASGWEGPADATAVSGTRGVRATGGGGFAYDGGFTATFDPDGRVEVAARDAQLAWTLPNPYGNGGPSVPWSLEATATGLVYAQPGVTVRYVIDDIGMKEDIVLMGPDLPPELVLPLAWGDDTTLWVEPGSPIGVFGASGRIFDLAQPYVTDAAGRTTPLAFAPDLAAHLLRIPLPSELRGAPFPLTIDPTTTFTLRDNGPTYKLGEQMGYAVAVGDFNGDGYGDLLTGAPFWGWGTHSTVGYAYIYYGPFNADKTAPDVRINGTTIDSGRFGFAVAAGKFNNDVYWDALVAHISDQALPVAGPVDIFYGSASLAGDLSTPDVKFEPPSDARNFGWAVAAGNIDNANYDDVLIGEIGRDDNGDSAIADGVVYLYKSPFAADITTASYTLYPSSNATGQLGKSIAVGKIDGDAYPDIVAGEPAFSGTGCGGRIQFYKGVGFASGSGARYPNATITAPTGCGSGAQFGVALATGRVNGDAYADVLVGAPTRNTDDGSAYLYLANAGGTGLTSGASASLTLNNQVIHERFGSAVAIADVNGDNAGDAIVGAPYAPGSGGAGTARGRMYWFDNPLVDTTPDATVYGDQDNEHLGTSLASGRFSSDTRLQIAIGAPQWDKNAANNSDNDGRAVVATVPEASAVLIALTMLAFAMSSRARRVRRPKSAAVGSVI